MESWNENLTSNYQKFNLINHPNINNFIYQYLVTRLKQPILNLGSGDASVCLLFLDQKFTNVDKYPPSNTEAKIIKMDAEQFIKKCHPASYQTIISLFSIHHFRYYHLKKDINRILKPKGEFLAFSISPQSYFFGNKCFNRLFFSKGFPPLTLPLYDRHEILIPCNRPFLISFIKKLAWSNLTLLTSLQIAKLIRIVPYYLDKIFLTIDITRLPKIK